MDKGGGGRDRKRTFEGDDDDFLLTIPTPLLDSAKRIHKHACVNDDDISLLCGGLLSIFAPTLPRCSRALLLLVLVLLMRVRGGDPDAADGELASL
jgi:hypothetical protein